MLYRWKLHPGSEASFVDAWSRVTALLHTERGSLGARLHRGADDIWYSYAQWPSAEARAQSAAAGPVDPQASKQMRAAVAEELPEVILECHSDFMVGSASQPQTLSVEDRLELTRLEEAMWREETRFDMQFMERYLAPDFFEFGRSGRTYTRAMTLAVPRQPTDAVLPLPDLAIRLLDERTAQLTYNSAVTYDGVVEHAHRSSVWSKTGRGWVMRFHQGTPFTP